MDSQVANQYFERNKNRKLRLDPYLIRRMGLIKNRVVLKIEEFYLNCIPFEISPSGCRALSILDPREVEFFQGFIEGTHKITFVFKNPLYTKEMSIPLLVKIQGFSQYNEESRYCLIDLTFVRVSHEFKEILVTLMTTLDKLNKLFADPQLSRKVVGSPEMKAALGDDHVFVSVGGSEPSRSKVVSLGMRSCRTFCECPHQEVEPAKDDLWEIDYGQPGRAGSFFAKGRLKKRTPQGEVPDFFFMDFDLDFSPGWIEHLAPLLAKRVPDAEKEGLPEGNGTAENQAPPTR